METPTPAVAPVSIGVVPSATFSKPLINAILGAYVECAATIEEIANQNNIAVSQVLECLHEQAPFLRNMLNTLESRVRIIASRAEAVAIETLREIALFAREQESRRKAASKLLSHFKRAVTSTRQRAGSVSDRPSAHTSRDDAQSQTRATSAPSPRRDGEKVPSPTGEGDEGRLARATNACSQTHSEPPSSLGGAEPHTVDYSLASEPGA